LPSLIDVPRVRREMSTTRHDALFKAVFGQPEHARGALRAVVPAAMAEALDWSTLALQPGSFVDPGLNPSHTDLLYAAAWRSGAAAPAYVLFEHQSSHDRWMPLRLLRYMVRIWEHWLKDHEHAEVLPAIVPVVLYHGDERWSAPQAFDALLDVPEVIRPALTEYVVRFAYVLDHLTEIPDDRLRTRSPTTALVDLCLKHAWRGAPFVAILSQSGDLMREARRTHEGREAFRFVVSYICVVNDAKHRQALTAVLEREIGPEAKDIIMTIGEQFIEQGIQQGERRLLLHQLRKRFGAQVNADTELRLASATPEQIALWADRVLSAATLAELFAD
jgi:predicted transposase/invertase (TIGR01784 family)